MFTSQFESNALEGVVGWKLTYVQTTVRWLLIPMVILEFVLMTLYAAQMYLARREAVVNRWAEGRVPVLEKDD
jgi:hypothetical protein